MYTDLGRIHIYRSVSSLLGLLVACALFCMPFEVSGSSVSSANTEYQNIINDMNVLQGDARRSKWREPWEDLATRFEALYKKYPSWSGRPHALLSAARSYDALSRHSGSRQDTLKAYAYYDAFLRAYSDHAEADQALMYSVRLAAIKRDASEAKRRATILSRDYPESPYVVVAKHLGGIKLMSSAAFGKAETSLNSKQFIAAQARYQRLVKYMEILQKDARRSKWREPWETLAGYFESLYSANPAWPDRGLALFGAARAYDALSRLSGKADDTRKAFAHYDRAVNDFPNHEMHEKILVESIHFAAAKRDAKEALRRVEKLRKLYPKSSHLEEAQYLADAARMPSKELKEQKKRVSVKNKELKAEHERLVEAMDRLSRDSRRSKWRDPWEVLATRLKVLHDKNRSWSDRPLALLDSARAYDALARRSGAIQDTKKAYDQYDAVVKLHPRHALADQALLKSIELAVDKRDGAEAKRRALRLIKNYPKSPYLAQAQRLGGISKGVAAKTVKQSDATSAQAVMKRIAWTSKKDTVTITLTYDEPVDWIVRSQAASTKKKLPFRLILETPRLRSDKQIKPKASVRQSLLTQVRVEHTLAKHSEISFDFKALKSFSVETLSSPFRIVITASSSSKTLVGGVLLGGVLRARGQEVKLGKIKLDVNLAAQLGLTVRAVVLDAGHGGKDPGAMHNGLVERDIALDIAKKVGAILQKRGLKVIYTRQKDVWVSLADRSVLAKEKSADIFVSIHMNASSNNKIHGFETYYLDFAASPAAKRLAAVENAVGGRSLGALEGLLADMILGIRRVESRRLASQIQNKTLAKMKSRKYTVYDGSIRGAPFHVLMGSGIPGVLVEVGYCSNKREAKRLASAKYRTYLAQGIADGILAYADTLQATQ